MTTEQPGWVRPARLARALEMAARMGKRGEWVAQAQWLAEAKRLESLR